MRPAKKEVMEHFKNAEKVRCLYDGVVYDYKPDERGIHLYDDGYWMDSNTIRVKISDRDQLAEIVTYKNPSLTLDQAI